MHWISGEPPSFPVQCMAKTRYRQPDQACQIEEDSSCGLRITFDNAQRAVTPGQYVVLYDGPTCLGGGIIESTWQDETAPASA